MKNKILAIMLTFIMLLMVFEVGAFSTRAQQLGEWQIENGGGHYSESNGTIIVWRNETDPGGIILYKELNQQTDFNVSLQVEAIVSNGFGFMLRSDLPFFGSTHGVNMEFGTQNLSRYGHFLLARYVNGWTWVNFVGNVTKNEVWYTMKLSVFKSPFHILAQAFDPNGILLGSFDASDMTNLSFDAVKYVGFGIWNVGEFNVRNVSIPSGRSPATWTVDANGTGDFSSIQAAINNAIDGDTIFVKSGTYYEHLLIDKTLTLVGENAETTVIDGGGIDPPRVVDIPANNVNVSRFTIQHSRGGGSAIWLDTYVNLTISNTIIANNGDGIRIIRSSGNIIRDNFVSNNPYSSIGFDWCHDNIVQNNTVIRNFIGVSAGASYNNTFSQNKILENSNGIAIHAGSFSNTYFENNVTGNGIGVTSWTDPVNNTFYHNNFVNNSQQTNVNSPNIWDNGYPSGGNYWSDYTGTDANSDGIGDTPHVINAKNQDNYPLMKKSPIPPSKIPSVEWSKTYPGATAVDGWPYTVIQTSDGGYAIAGRTEAFGAGSFDFWLIKTDADGNMQWNKTYGGANYEKVFSVIQTSDGGYVIVGDSWSFSGWYDAWIVKTDADGNMQWNQVYGGADIDTAMSVVQTSDGGYAVGGTTSSFGAGAYDGWLIKTDADGNMQWNKTYGGADNDQFQSIVETDDGGYALAGATRNSFDHPGKVTAYLVKTDSDGNMQWNRTFSRTAGEDFGRSLSQTSDGGFAIAGETDHWGNAEAWLIKIDATGNLAWDKTYGGTNWDAANSIVHTADDGYALAGQTYSFGAGDSDFWLVKTDKDGNMQWNETYGGTGNDVGWSAVQTLDGGYALTGYTNSFSGDGSYEVWLIKLAPTLLQPTPPIANFTWAPSKPIIGEPIVFDATSSQQGWNGTSQTPITLYQWDFGDGNTTTGLTVTHTYYVQGNFTITLNVTDSQGRWNTSQEQIQIGQPYGPAAQFAASFGVARVDDMIEFNASASLSGWNGSSATPIVAYIWNFGDGNSTSSADSTTNHSYATPGKFNVTLTVVDVQGMNSSVSQMILVTMPTSISISTNASATIVGFAVNINGTLSDFYGNGIQGETVVLYYTFPGVGSWFPMTSSATDVLGDYSAQWIPSATGNFQIKAEWIGNTTHSGASSNITLGSIPAMNQYVFTVESNSTVSALAFNTTNWELSFSVSGPNGTTGYVRVTIAKSLIFDITNIRVYLDDAQSQYSIESVDESWLLTFNYLHSTHRFVVDLDVTIVPEYPSTTLLLAGIAVLMSFTLAINRRKRQNQSGSRLYW